MCLVVNLGTGRIHSSFEILWIFSCHNLRLKYTIRIITRNPSLKKIYKLQKNVGATEILKYFVAAHNTQCDLSRLERNHYSIANPYNR